MEGTQEPPAKRPRVDEDRAKVCYTSEHSYVLRGLNEQRKKGLFCDVVLVVDDARFPAHRSTLAASSDYFNSMFTIGMQELDQKEVKLVGVSSNGLEVVLDFLYGNEVSLDGTIVESVLLTAHLLQVLKLVDMCCEYLESDLNDENYLHLQELASTYSLKCLDSSIDCFILKNFQRLCFAPSFSEKVSVEKLCLYLDSDRLQVKEEFDLLKCAMQWLLYCRERFKEAGRLFENIRFPFITKRDHLKRFVYIRALHMPNKQSHLLCLINEAMYYHKNLFAQPVLQNRRSTPRADGKKLLFLGGEVFELQPVEKNVRYLDAKMQKWIPETDSPNWRGDFCVAVLGNYIFCAGGYAVDPATQYVHNIVYRYDPRLKTWTKVASMKHCRRSFYLAALEDRLVAVGGEWASHIYGSVETYNPRTNTWSFVATLPRSYYNHAGTTYKQHVYISGGESRRHKKASKALLCYDYRTDTWEEKASMSTRRCDHSMCTLDDRIYAIGGTDGKHSAAHYSVECYSLLSDQWTTVAPLLQRTTYSAAAAWRGEICVMGGMPKRKGKSLKTVQVYDPKENKWFKGMNLPRRMTRVKACVCMLMETTDP